MESSGDCNYGGTRTGTPQLQVLHYLHTCDTKGLGLAGLKGSGQSFANSRTQVYINKLYYVVSSTPIQVPADASGSLTIVEKTDGLHAAVLAASVDKDIITFNPMDRTFAKLATLESPKAKRLFQEAIISAGSWDELSGLFGQQQPDVMRSKAVLVSSSSFASSFTFDGPISISKTAQRVTFECFHITAGALSLVGNLMLGLEAEDQTGSEALGISATIIGFLIAVSNRAGDLLVPMYPVQCLPFKILSRLVTSFVVGCKVLFSGPAQWVFQKLRIGTMVVENARGVGGVINGVLVIHGLVVTMWHFYELSENALWDAAIVGEVSSLASYASRLAYGWAVNDKEQTSRLVAIIMMGAADDVFGALQLAQAGVGESALT
ncbi:hypothetical protein IFM46972_11510 [Aspergillus udagawae]|uniref:Uncharacterized protein n=1 Tax=Aspergillus udagawae TaxID=91492 RepID=A0A8H3XS24_9EURO|nr:hypothetical protein IFM46972_11510 [Aspergillus udagawae]